MELDPNNVEALSNLVTLDIAARKPSVARSLVDSHIARRPDDPRILILAARTYAATGGIDRAEELLKHAVDSDPANLQAYRLLGQLYTAEHRLSDARDEFAQIAQRDPRSVVAHTVLGILFELDHQGTESEKEYEAALKIDPRAAVAANNLAWIFVDSGRNSDRALELAQAAKAKLPDDPHVSDTLGWVFYKRHMNAQAVDMLKQSVSADPNNPTAVFHLGMAYFENGDWPNAKTSLTQALKLNPDANVAKEARDALAKIG